MNDQYTEESLISSLREGDVDAFRYLYKYYYKSLFRVIQQIVKDTSHTEDVLQDTFVKVWARFYQYDDKQSALATWLYRVARNTALDALDQRKIIYLSIGPEEEALPTATDTEAYTDIVGVEYIVSQHLTPHQWQLIRLSYWEGYTHKEIAEALSLPLGTVKTRILKSLLRLRLILQ